VNRAKRKNNPWKKAKLEIRNPKFETIPNDQKTQNSKQGRFGFCISNFLCLFRISSFGFRILFVIIWLTI